MARAIYEIQLVCENSGGRSQASEWGIVAPRLLSDLNLKSRLSGSSGYKDSIRHYVSSSSEIAQLAVQPGSASDLAAMVCALLLIWSFLSRF